MCAKSWTSFAAIRAEEIRGRRPLAERMCPDGKGGGRNSDKTIITMIINTGIRLENISLMYEYDHIIISVP